MRTMCTVRGMSCRGLEAPVQVAVPSGDTNIGETSRNALESRQLSPSFFARPTLRVARDLLGMYLVRAIDGKTLSGRIVETEAYAGEDDLACHASRGRTKRTEVLYAPPGMLYIYLIYGMHWCLNIVTERKDFPAAVLIRALEPAEGMEMMVKNRGICLARGKRVAKVQRARTRNLTNGPGKLCQALGITGEMHGKCMSLNSLRIEDRGVRLAPDQIGAGWT